MDEQRSFEERYKDPEQVGLAFGHVEGRIDDLEVSLVEALGAIAVAETREERLEALDRLCERQPTMKAHR
ncbi:MAG: hypothetical protein M3R38_19475 [Actinomycetota bacterium]|nr:hypothetical protein [Actinomycetota bacterium]